MSLLTLKFFQSKVIGKGGTLEALLNAFAESDYDLGYFCVSDKKFSDPALAYWQNLDEAIDNIALAYEVGRLTFIANKRGNPLQFVVEMEWRRDRLGNLRKHIFRAYTDKGYIFLDEDGDYLAEQLLDIAKQLYHICKPEYGWIEKIGMRGYTTKKDVVAKKLHHIYWANFFGPDYVEKFGREFLLEAPGWKHEELGDGGLLYVLKPTLAYRRANEINDLVKKYFNAEIVRQRIKGGSFLAC